MKRVRQDAVKDAVKQEGMKQEQKREKVAQAVVKKRVWWPWVVAIVGLVTVFETYSPALNGPFVLDDLYLLFANPWAPTVNFVFWISNPRPFLMFSYWLNYQQAAAEPYSYHVTNVLLHFAGAVVFTWIVLRLLELASVQGLKRTVLAIFAGGLFLLHPLQTESVAYVASRSEVLSVLLYMSAFALFLYRGVERLSLLRAIAILVLFAAAVSTKEHALTLPLLLILADWFWGLGGVRRNAMFYGLLAAGCIPGGWFVWRTLSVASSAGFRVQGLSPEAYFFTQCRVIWMYVELFFLPFGQNADPDIALSNGPLEHGAIFGLVGLVALAVAAWIFRKKYPLAAFGVFTFLLLLAPTSSFIPIRDVLAERRVYLPFLGLVLIALEFLRRLAAQHLIWIGVAVLGLSSMLTYRRSVLWGQPLELWRDTVEKSSGKWRPRFQLAHAYYSLGQCPKALENFEAASRLGPVDVPLLVDWGLSLDCVGRSDEALVKLRDAVGREPSAHIYSQIGMIYGKRKDMPAALGALEQAEKLDPTYDMIYVYRGNVFEVSGDKAAAAEQYRRAQTLNPYNQGTQDALVRVGR